MLKLIFSLGLTFTVLFTQRQSVQKLAPQEFENKMKVKKSFILLDVRTLNEFKQGHLDKSTHLDYYRKDLQSEVSKLDKTKPVFVYCAVGGRSNRAAALLSSLGFTEVYDLTGGIQAWSHAKKPIIQ